MARHKWGISARKKGKFMLEEVPWKALKMDKNWQSIMLPASTSIRLYTGRPNWMSWFWKRKGVVGDGWVILARHSQYQDTTLLMLAKRPRSNKIIQQCLVPLLKKRCLMLLNLSDGKEGRGLSKIVRKNFQWSFVLSISWNFNEIFSKST